MIEKCNFCGDTHETGGEFFYNGIQYKECPKIPLNYRFISENQTELDKIISAKISTMTKKDIEKMLLDDWRKAYCVDFKTTLGDDFKMNITADRLNISALIYPKCLRGIIKSLNLRSNINVRLLKDDVFQSFKDKSYFPAIVKAKKLYPHDDLYMVIPNEKLN